MSANAECAPSKSSRVARGRFYSGIVLRTVYGLRRFNLLELQPGVGVYVTLEPVLIKAGVRKKGGGVLKEPHVIPAGSVLIKRSNGHGHPLYAIYEGGLYEARRGLLHAVAGYDETLVGGADGELKSTVVEIDALGAVFDFLGEWRTLAEHQREALIEALAVFVAAHDGDRNTSKVAATDSVLAVQDLCDQTGRKNPSVVKVRLSEAERELWNRHFDCRKIQPRLIYRLAVVENELELEIGAVRAVYGQIRYVVDHYRKQNPERIPSWYIDRLEKQANWLKLLKARPFAALAAKLEPWLDARIKEFRTGVLSLVFSDSHKYVLNQLERATARHFLCQVLETVSVLPTAPKAVELRAERAKQLARDFKARHAFLFPRLGKAEDPPMWRWHFREANLALGVGNLEIAKELYDLATDDLVDLA